MKTTIENAVKMIEASNGKIFSVTFTKKDGSSREMVARTGVTSHLKGGELAYDPKEYDLITVFDVQKNGYRMIQKNTISQIKMEGKKYDVIQ